MSSFSPWDYFQFSSLQVSKPINALRNISFYDLKLANTFLIHNLKLDWKLPNHMQQFFSLLHRAKATAIRDIKTFRETIILKTYVISSSLKPYSFIRVSWFTYTSLHLFTAVFTNLSAKINIDKLIRNIRANMLKDLQQYIIYILYLQI